MPNVIQAILSGGNVFRTKPVYQYASGMILEFSGADLPDTFEVDFANDQKGASITQIATNSRVTIPDQFFIPGACIYVYLVEVGQNYAVTRDPVCIIPISPRAMRTNEEPTPSQQSALDEAIAALNDAVESAETAIEHYPQIVDGTWRVWDVSAGEWVDTGVSAQGPQGVQGPPGQDGTDGQDGIPGADGKDGKDGKDGTNGKDGADGADGYSPTASVSKSGSTATITITDKNGTTTETVSDGTNGTNGQDGTDGVSPTVTIASITGGHSVTITDKDHPTGQSFDVMDGSPSDQQVTTAVDAWLDDHPEATTTVEDGAITKAKLDSDLQDTVDDVADLKSATTALEDCDRDGYRHVVNFINGAYDKSTLAYSANAKRICSPGMVFVEKGDVISIDCGSYGFFLKLYEGDLASYSLIRDDASQKTDDETITVYVDGFFYVLFCDPTSPNTTNVSADQFDGAITITSYAMKKADKSQLADYKDGYAVTHLNVLDDAVLVSSRNYWNKRPGTNILTLSTPSGTTTYYSYLVPVDGESVYTFKNQTRYIFPVASDGVTALANAVESATSIDTSQYTGCKYIAISVRSDTYDMSTYCVSKGATAKKENTYTYPGWFNGKFNPLEDKVDDLEDELEEFEDGYEVVNLNLLEGLTPTSETQYYSKKATTGKLILNTASTATYNSWVVPVDGTSKYTMSYTTRFIFAVAADGETVIGDGVETTTSIDTSQYEGCKYIAISVRNDDQQHPMSTYYVSKGNVARTGEETIPPGWLGDKLDALEDQINSLDVKPKRNKIYMLTDTSFSAEKNFSDFSTSVKAKSLHIVVNPTSFTSVTVGLRNATRSVFYAQVTSSSVYLYDYNGGLTAHTQTYSHGLTIADNLSIDVYAEANTGAYYVRVGTNGTEYVTPAAFNIAPTGLIYPYASMEGSASFVQFCVDVNTQRPIWLFGDSYLGTNNTARWAYYLVNREMDGRVMMDAYAGENSTSAYASLEKLIECGVPDYIVWCLGMNDGGDTGTTPNNTWLGKVESVIALCEENNITPILATVPTVPSVNNEGKNAWVRESGYQYIDFAKAVGASDQGVWFDGMLSSDNVHPSITGAITLYHAALAGCPQFSQK